MAEFLPPARPSKRQEVIILCDGMPSIPRKQSIVEYLSAQRVLGFLPAMARSMGEWRAISRALSARGHSRHRQRTALTESKDFAFGRRFRCSPDKIFVIGGSFGGAAAILSSLDPRITKVIANCPVVDWAILRKEQKKETSNPSYPAYIRAAFGNGYRLSAKNWNKLHGGVFYNPAHHLKELTASKILMFHAKDDPYIPWKLVDGFARRVGHKTQTSLARRPS